MANPAVKRSMLDSSMDVFLQDSFGNLGQQVDIDYTQLIPERTEVFVESFLKDEQGDNIENEAVHNIMHRFIRYAKLNGFNKFLILGAFGHGKTEQMCIGYPLAELAKNPNLIIKIVHVNEDEAVKRCKAIRDYIEKDEDLHALAPHIKPTKNWGAKHFTIEKGVINKEPSSQAYGVLASGIGGRCNLLILDDPQDLKTAVYEPTTRERIEAQIKNIWLTRLTQPKVTHEVLAMMNKWHENDFAAYVQSNPTWAWMEIGVNDDFNSLFYRDSFGRKVDIPLWSKFDKEALLAKRAEIGEREFARGYQLKPYSDDDKTFPDFPKCVKQGVSPFSVVEHKNNWIFVGGIDFSSKARPGTILVVLAAHRKTGLKVPVYCSMMKGTNSLVQQMVDCHIQFGVDLFIAENNGVQDAIIDMMVTSLGDSKYKRYGIKIEEFLTGRNKADPFSGLPSIQKEFENNEWMFCIEDGINETDIDINRESDRTWMEFKNHPYYATSDIVMAFWFAREGVKNFFRFGANEPEFY